MRRLITIIAVAALALPAAAVADEPVLTPQQTANQQCKTQLAAMGAATFKQTYGTNANKSNAWGKCVSKLASTAVHAADNAAKQCKAERLTLGEEAFAKKYGTNRNGKNAFGKCVSMKAQAAAEHETDVTVGAAKSCKAEQAADRAAFTKKYASFGKCVSAKSKGK